MSKTTFNPMVRSLAVVVLALLFYPAGAFAVDNPTARFEAANKLYEEARYKEAAAAYQEILKSDEGSAAIYFNLGNAFFKAGQLGQAIVAYRTAQNLAPRDPDVRANLQFARETAQGPRIEAGRVERFFSKLNLDEWTFIAAGAVWLWLLIQAAMQLNPTLRVSLRMLSHTLASIALVFCACLVASIYNFKEVRIATVTVEQAQVRNGPLEESQSAFAVHDGAELRALDFKGDWIMVSAGPGRTGWIRRDAVVLPSS